jgi:hypothetical protein
MSQKYEMTDETKLVEGRILHRIKALRDFGGGFIKVKAGELGGWIQCEENLSHGGTAWVYDDACVMDSGKIVNSARVYDTATVRDKAVVAGTALVCEHALIRDSAVVFGHALVRGNAIVGGTSGIFGNAHVDGHAYVRGDAKIYEDAVVTGDTTVITGRAAVGGATHIDGGMVTKNIYICGAPLLVGSQICIFENEHYLVVGGYARPDMCLTFARTNDCRIRLCSGNYTGDVEDYKMSLVNAEPAEVWRIDNYYKSAIELAKNYITDTIYMKEDGK